MISPSLLLSLSLLLVGTLFAIAWYGDRRGALQAPWRAWVYTLSLAVYCTSWAFYGTIHQAADHGWPVPPTYVGTVLLFALAHGFLRRLHQLTRQHNITSIADFIAARYGKSQWIASGVSLVACVAVLPYIALQLKAVASSYRLLSGLDTATPGPWWQDTGFYVALLLAGFAMLFGTRRASITEHQPGLMLAVAFESLFKLLAFVLVGGFILWQWQGSDVLQLSQQALSQSSAPAWDRYLSLVLLGALAMFCLPRQFYVGMVECRSDRDLGRARWAFPLYLLLMSLFTLPVAQIGLHVYGISDGIGAVDPDTYLLRLPLDLGQPGLALLAYLGGFAAATSMVILSSVALSIMISNDLVLPWWLRQGRRVPVLYIRRLSIFVILLLAWLYYRHLGESETLAAMGGIAFAGAAQFAPAMILGVYWRGLSAAAVATGLSLGFIVWLWTLVLPIGAESGLLAQHILDQGPAGWHWLRPHALFGLSGIDALAHGSLWSLGANLLGLLLVQWWRPANVEQRSAAVDYLSGSLGPPSGQLEGALLYRLLQRFIGTAAARRILAAESSGPASAEQMHAAERALAGVLGTASARLLLDGLSRRRGMAAAEVAAIVSQAGQVVQFNRELLDVVFAHISQGVSVIDRDLRLVAWNQRYAELFAYPAGLLRPGRPIAELVRYNAQRGWCGSGSIDEHVEKRLDWLRQGRHHRFERQRPDGIVLEMRGQPLPGGGFVTTFNDVTAYKQTQLELEQLNRALEARVAERTAALAQARDDAERANRSKGRFLAATSHDLAQPLNAARLLVSTVQKHCVTEAGRDLAQTLLPQLSQVLDHAEGLLAELQEMSRLERGLFNPKPRPLPLARLFQQLAAEFQPSAQHQGLSLRVVPTQLWVDSDERMLHRILQNLLANAVRYTRNGGIVLGARRTASGQQVRVEIWDSGSGIAQDQRESIFQEFQRGSDAAGTGLGLGLAITKRLAELLGHPLGFSSNLGQGTRFHLYLPRTTARRPTLAAPTEKLNERQHTGHILCIDDDPSVLSALLAWLHSRGYSAQGFTSASAALAYIEQSSAAPQPQAVIADYHLAPGEDGLGLIRALRLHYGIALPAIILSADTSAALKHLLADTDILLLSKPVKPLALQSALQRLL